jgi:hypothetical protein
MKKQQKGESAKKSNTPQQPKVQKPKLEINSETTMVIHVFRKGAFKCHGFDASKSKKFRRKLRKSGKLFFEPAQYFQEEEVINAQNVAVMFAISDEARTAARVTPSDWKRKSRYEKLDLFAQGFKKHPTDKVEWSLIN